jgi:hypothetical protein
VVIDRCEWRILTSNTETKIELATIVTVVLWELQPNGDTVVGGYFFFLLRSDISPARFAYRRTPEVGWNKRPSQDLELGACVKTFGGQSLQYELSI